ncbi:hypothetical protein QBC38DRAFT_263439 [Podospora fimiseda]|uniref:DNA (cytosine-5)-methyltransferase 1 replication foci domain-containing protein n=1 Tax=Podospora fimiseda TaxID=252190 RepID=A0AAN7BLG9_9PEZI|nr:hypothetical protein QBC38DRAFT_263439 [Podospora fimiseda]
MAGPGRPRRRRFSNPDRYAKECNLLKPVAVDSDDTDWPIFVIKDATVYRRDGRTMANPLMAHWEGPYIIRGTLEVDDPELYPRLVNRNIKTALIEVENCTKYSMGDDPVAFWVSGPCGWYEIRPSVKYQRVYNEILEAINLYYGIFVAYEKYEKTRKKKKKTNPPTLDELFLDYAIRVGNGIVRDEVEALCHKWAEWLIAHFPKEEELNWKDTAFATWVEDSHPNLVKKVEDAAKGLLPPAPLPELPPSSPEPDSQTNRAASTFSQSVYDDSSDIEMKDQSQVLPTRGKGITETPVPIPEKYRSFGSAANPTASASPAPAQPANTEPASDSPINHLLSALNETAEETDIRTSTASKIINNIFFKCRVSQYSAAKEVIAYYAKDLLPHLGPKWNGTAFYKWVKDMAANPLTNYQYTTPDKIPGQAVRRNKGGARTTAATKSTSVSDVPPVINLDRRTRKSASNTPAGDGLAGDDSQSLLRNRSSGKRATLRLTASKKRPASFLDEDNILEDTGSRGNKSSKRTYMSDDEEEEDMDSVSNDDDDSSATESGNEADPHSNPVTSRLPAPEGFYRVVLMAERLPSTEPTGHLGTWVCQHEDCNHIVRDAEDAAGQALVQEHIDYHEAQKAKMDLALQESRGHLPVKNLLEKIQNIGEQNLRRKRGTLENGITTLPAPIKRRLFF